MEFNVRFPKLVIVFGLSLILVLLRYLLLSFRNRFASLCYIAWFIALLHIVKLPSIVNVSSLRFNKLVVNFVVENCLKRVKKFCFNVGLTDRPMSNRYVHTNVLIK